MYDQVPLQGYPLGEASLPSKLGLLQANMTYMHGKHGAGYHWIPELYGCMKLPVFEGIVAALEKHNVR